MIPCRFFIKGHCKRGESCRYSHEITTSTSNPSRPPPPALQPDSSTGRPWREKRPFTPATSARKDAFSPKPLQSSDSAHPTQDLRSQIPCYHHARGNCRNGSACPYSHLDGSDQMVEETSDPEVRPLQIYAFDILRHQYYLLMPFRRNQTTMISHESFVARWPSSNAALNCLRFPFPQTFPPLGSMGYPKGVHRILLPLFCRA